GIGMVSIEWPSRPTGSGWRPGALIAQSSCGSPPRSRMCWPAASSERCGLFFLKSVRDETRDDVRRKRDRFVVQTFQHKTEDKPEEEVVRSIEIPHGNGSRPLHYATETEALRRSKARRAAGK